jgi:hypothetical protein
MDGFSQKSPKSYTDGCELISSLWISNLNFGETSSMREIYFKKLTMK